MVNSYCIKSAVVVSLLGLMVIGCGEEPDPASLVVNLRILGISAEPADLAVAEAMSLEALVASPGVDAADVSYSWEWCPFTQGEDEQYACLTDGVDPELAVLFDLGTEATATLDAVIVLPVLTLICETLESETEGLDLSSIEGLVSIPDCDVGMDVTVRLTVTAAGQERVGLKQVFVWLADPDELQRNRNPEISAVTFNGTDAPEGEIIEVRADQPFEWFVDVPESSLETFLLRSDPESDTRRESINYAVLASAGSWEDDYAFADDEYVTRAVAGAAEQRFEDGELPTTMDVYFVLRDERGGIVWATRQLTVVE